MACEFQKDIKFDDIVAGDLVLVELFGEDNFTFLGDRRGIAKIRFGDAWHFEGMPPLYKEALGYRLFRVTVMDAEHDAKNFERVLVLAETSESSDAILLAGEVRRLRKIEDGLKNLVAMRKQVVEALRTEADEWDSMGAWQSAGFNRDNADKIMGEVWPLEALLNE